MITILTEKPSAARNFAKALGGMSGKYNGEEYEIVHSLGHLFSFPEDPDKLAGDKYKSWSWNTLPWDANEFKWKKYRHKDTKDVYDKIKRSVARADEVVIATDVDPSGEGQLLAWEILDSLKWKGLTTRMYFMDESEKEIQKAFRERKKLPKMEKDGDFLKADTRSKFDYLSMQITRVASLCASQAGKRMVVREGRLKSVMVYLVGEQLELVNNYERKPFYTARYIDENGHIYKRKDKDEDRYTDKAEVSLEKYKPSAVIVDKEEKKHSTPPTLMDLAALSSVLASRGFKAKDVLAVYQKMYEQQYVSYPRTEDKFVSPEQFNELLPLTDKIAGVVGVNTKLLTHTKPRPSHVKEGGAHGANRPGPTVPSSLADIEAKFGKCGKAIYETLAKGYLAILAEDYEYRHQTGHLKDYPEFMGSANIPVSMGYKAIFDADALSKDEAENENNLPLGKKAESFVFEGANPKPQNPTSNWLIGKNGKLTKFNVGTGATRTSTLAEITNVKSKTQLMTETKGVLGLTEIGWMSYKLLNGCYIASPEVTETLFNEMEEVGKFKKKPAEVIERVTEITRHDMEKMKQNASEIKPDRAEHVVNGKTVSFKKSWGNYTFSDEEIEKLQNGEEIEFVTTNKYGKTVTVHGKLAEQEYKGKTFWGFKGEVLSDDKVSGIINFGKHKGEKVSFKREWSGHVFTENELDRLFDGCTIEITATSKKGNQFTVSGELAEQTYKGHKFWGFKAHFE